MSASVRPILATAALALVATYTLAQNPASRLVPEAAAVTSAQSDPGFFRPTPDGTPVLNPVTPAPQPQAAPPGAPAQDAAQDRVVVQPVIVPAPAVQPDPTTAIRQVDDTLLRAELEARARMNANAPAPIAGAFTGSTSERDR